MIRFIVAGLLFWPAFIVCALFDRWVAGVVAGFVMMVIALAITWRITFKTWPRMVRRKRPDTR